MRFIPRRATRDISRLLGNFSVVMVVGPRQCGKSTLVRHAFPRWRHVDLERPADFAVMAADVEGFLEAQPDHLVIDEAQRLPELLPALRYVVDRHPRPGRFLLLGSAGPGLLRTASESLAGRMCVYELTPLRWLELASAKERKDRWFWGGFPPVHARRGARPRLEWLEGYVSAFLERDLPNLGIRLPAPKLRVLWTMLTHVHGHLLNVSDLARSLAVSAPTVAHYLDILEANFMIRRLQPFHANIQKRLSKSPKVYIRDSGLLHFLAGLRQSGELDSWPRRGNSFEGCVIEEMAALAAEKMVRPEVFFWRTQAGAEVDLLIKDGRRILLFEIKSGSVVDRHAIAGLRQCMKDLGLKRGWVISTSHERSAIGGGIEILPWSAITSGEYVIGR